VLKMQGVISADFVSADDRGVSRIAERFHGGPAPHFPRRGVYENRKSRSWEGEDMAKRKYSEVEMIGALKQMEAGRSAAEVGRELGVSKHTVYAWKAKYGGMSVGEAQRLKQLEDENGRLKKLVADLSLDKEMLKAVIEKNGWSS